VPIKQFCCYSWWDLAVDQMLSPPCIEPKYLLPYLQNPPESVYGNNVFKSKFCDLLQSYASSQGCRDIYLKVGSPLRNKCEIAYVVIVCTSRDLEVLYRYNPITFVLPDVFNPNDLVDGNGDRYMYDQNPILHHTLYEYTCIL